MCYSHVLHVFNGMYACFTNTGLIDCVYAVDILTSISIIHLV